MHCQQNVKIKIEIHEHRHNNVHTEHAVCHVLALTSALCANDVQRTWPQQHERPVNTNICVIKYEFFLPQLHCTTLDHTQTPIQAAIVGKS